MNEKDFDKNLDNIIIDGLIKEAEQENADFAASIRKMSDEEFEEMVNQSIYADSDVYDDKYSYSLTEFKMVQEYAKCHIHSSDIRYCMSREPVDDETTEKPVFISLEHKIDSPVSTRNKIINKHLRPWILATVAAIAVIIIVLIPSINSMNAKLCDSALYMGQIYTVAPGDGFDIYAASLDEVKQELPILKEKFEASMRVRYPKLGYNSNEFRESGWNLAMAYLKLHKKRNAIKVLKKLESQTQGSSFGEHCTKMLEQLD